VLLEIEPPRHADTGGSYHLLWTSLARSSNESTQTLQLLIERLAISCLRLADRRGCAEQWTIVGHAPTLAIFGDQLCAVIPQAARAASSGAGAEHLLDTWVGRRASVSFSRSASSLESSKCDALPT
jgi:hypothetical protein